MSVEEAAEQMKTEKYDVVVCDYQMPGQDGLQFLKELRQEGNTIPFIMFTGRGSEEIAIEALNLGANGYFNKHGEPETVYGELAHGIRQTVEAKRVTEALYKSESKSRTLLENLPQKIFFKGKNSVYISCNENYSRDLKIKSDEIAGRTDYDFYPKELAEKYRVDDKRIMTSGNTEEIDEEYVQDGRKVFVHTVKTPAKDKKGKIVGILGIFWDITERKKAQEVLENFNRELRKRIEEALIESKEKFRSLVEDASVAIATSDLKGRFTYINKALTDLLGYSHEELIGQPFKNFIHPADRGRVIRYSSGALCFR